MSQRVDLNDVRKLLQQYLSKGHFNEQIDDRVVQLIRPGNGISWTYDDVNGTLTPEINPGLFPHSELLGLTGDDHLQYLPINGGRDITGDQQFDQNVTISGSVTVAGSGYFPGGIVTSHSNLQNLGSDDHPQYTLADGTRIFTGTIAGVDPLDAQDLTTKVYVDTLVAASGGVMNTMVLLDLVMMTIYNIH